MAQKTDGVLENPIEKYIRSLPWSKDATETEKALVAGNIRAFYDYLKKEEILSSDVVIHISTDEAVHRLSKTTVFSNMESGVTILKKIAVAVGWDSIMIYAMKQLQVKGM